MRVISSRFDEQWSSGSVGGAGAGGGVAQAGQSALSRMVQRKAASGSNESRSLLQWDALAGPDNPTKGAVLGSAGGSVQETASNGVRGTGGSLPHGDTIQQAFGRHDVSGVSAHVGGASAAACDSLGANAYATGTSVAFKGAPSLHTAAHEAAHVVQQRAGVHLEGGVGKAGDQAEQHADAVADSVVQGKSAESLLDQMAPSTGSSAASGAAVQLQEAPGAPAPASAPAPATTPARGTPPAAATPAPASDTGERSRAGPATAPPAPSGSATQQSAEAGQRGEVGRGPAAASGPSRTPAENERRLTEQVARMRSIGSDEKRVHEGMLCLRRGPDQSRPTGTGALGVANRVDNALERAESRAAGRTVEAVATVRERVSSAWNAVRPGQAHATRPAEGHIDHEVRIPEIAIWDRYFIALNTAAAAISAYGSSPSAGGLTQVNRAVNDAQGIFRTNSQRLQQYRSRTESGGADTVTALQGVVVACGIVATICTGGMASVAGAGLAASAGVAGATTAVYTGATEFAGQASEVAHGERGAVNMREILGNAATAGVTAFLAALTGGIGGRLFTGAFRSVAGDRLTRIGASRAATALASRGGEFVMDFIGGATVGPILNTAARTCINRLRGRQPQLSYGEFCDAAVHEMFENVSLTNALVTALGHGVGRATRQSGHAGIGDQAGPLAPVDGTPPRAPITPAAPHGGPTRPAHPPPAHAGTTPAPTPLTPVPQRGAPVAARPREHAGRPIDANNPGQTDTRLPTTRPAPDAGVSLPARDVDPGPVAGYTVENTPVYRNALQRGERPQTRWRDADGLWHLTDGSTIRESRGTVHQADLDARRAPESASTPAHQLAAHAPEAAASGQNGHYASADPARLRSLEGMYQEPATLPHDTVVYRYDPAATGTIGHNGTTFWQTQPNAHYATPHLFESTVGELLATGQVRFDRGEPHQGGALGTSLIAIHSPSCSRMPGRTADSGVVGYYANTNGAVYRPDHPNHTPPDEAWLDNQGRRHFPEDGFPPDLR